MATKFILSKDYRQALMMKRVSRTKFRFTHHSYKTPKTSQIPKTRPLELSLQRKTDRERAALADFRLNLNSAAVHLD